MISHQEISAYILLGGKSSRMGKDKATMLWNQIPMYEHVCNVANQITANIHLVSSRNEHSLIERSIVSDLYVNMGPAAAVYSALMHCITKYALLLTCDMPLIHAALLSDLIENAKENSINLCKADERDYPFPGLYPITCTKSWKKLLDNGERSVLKICNQLNAVKVVFDHDMEAFMNVNTRSDFDKLIRINK